MSAPISVRLPNVLKYELEEIALMLDRPKTYIIRKALESYLEEYSDYLLALERLRDKDDKNISGKDLRDKLGL